MSCYYLHLPNNPPKVRHQCQKVRVRWTRRLFPPFSIGLGSALSPVLCELWDAGQVPFYFSDFGLHIC